MRCTFLSLTTAALFALVSAAGCEPGPVAAPTDLHATLDGPRDLGSDSAAADGGGGDADVADPCRIANGGCDANAACRATGAGTRSCTCRGIYVGDGLTCQRRALQLTPVQYGAVDPGANSMTVGDFNNDGKLDLAVANSVKNAATVYLGNGDGTLRASWNASLGAAADYSNTIDHGDFNGDGKLDLVVSHYTTRDVHILLGQGDGTFVVAFRYPAGVDLRSVTVGDMNGDKKLDLVMGQRYEYTLNILFGNGDGTFRAPQGYGTAQGPSQVAVGDLNNDGRMDIAAACSYAGVVSVLVNQGSAVFKPAVDSATPGKVANTVMADFNGDGALDVADAGAGIVYVLLGNGDGTLRASQALATAGGGFVAADFDFDGKADLAQVAPGGVLLWIGKGDGTFAAARTISYGHTPAYVTSGDFNGDGGPDLALVNSDDTITILLW